MALHNAAVVNFVLFVLCEMVFHQVLFAAGNNRFFYSDPDPNLATALQQRGHFTFMHFIRQGNMENLLGSSGAYTVFAPVDAAFKEIQPNLSARFKQHPTALWNFITYHITNGALMMEDIKDGGSMTSLIGHLAYTNKLEKGGKIKAWIQGCKILQSDIKINQGGVLHIIDKAMQLPATNFMPFFENSLDHTFIHRIFKSSGLKIPTGVTFLAPLDSSFLKLPAKLRNTLTTSKRLQKQIIQHHTIPIAMCSERMLAEKEYFNMTSSLGINLRSYKYPFLRTKLFIESSVYLGSTPIHGGFIAAISAVLIPKSRHNVLETARINSASQFDALVHRCGLAGMLSQLHTTFTIFAPTDEAFRSMDKKIWNQIKDEITLLKQVVQMHIVRYPRNVEQLSEIQRLNTISKDSKTWNSSTIRFNRFYNRTVVEGALVIHENILAANGILNIIDRVILPKSKTLHHICLEDPRTSYFRAIVKRAGFKDLLARNHLHFTIFVPTNAAFADWFSQPKFRFYHTTNEYRLVLRKHTVHGEFFTETMKGDNIYELRTLFARNNLRLHKIHGRSNGFQIMKYGASSVETDIIASNGILHLIDKVLD